MAPLYIMVCDSVQNNELFQDCDITTIIVILSKKYCNGIMIIYDNILTIVKSSSMISLGQVCSKQRFTYRWGLWSRQRLSPTRHNADTRV